MHLGENILLQKEINVNKDNLKIYLNKNKGDTPNLIEIKNNGTHFSNIFRKNILIFYVHNCHFLNAIFIQ